MRSSKRHPWNCQRRAAAAGSETNIKYSTCNGGGSPEYLYQCITACRTVIGESRTGLVPRSQTSGGSGTGLTGEDTGTEMVGWPAYRCMYLYLYLLRTRKKMQRAQEKKSPQRCEEDANSSLCVPMTEAKRHWQKSLAYYRVHFQ